MDRCSMESFPSFVVSSARDHRFFASNSVDFSDSLKRNRRSIAPANASSRTRDDGKQEEEKAPTSERAEGRRSRWLRGSTMLERRIDSEWRRTFSIFREPIFGASRNAGKNAPGVLGSERGTTDARRPVPRGHHGNDLPVCNNERGIEARAIRKRDDTLLSRASHARERNRSSDKCKRRGKRRALPEKEEKRKKKKKEGRRGFAFRPLAITDFPISARADPSLWDG